MVNPPLVTSSLALSFINEYLISGAINRDAYDFMLYAKYCV